MTRTIASKVVREDDRYLIQDILQSTVALIMNSVTLSGSLDSRTNLNVMWFTLNEGMSRVSEDEISTS